MTTFIGIVLLACGLVAVIFAVASILRNTFTYHWERRRDGLLFGGAALLLLLLGAFFLTHPGDTEDILMGLGAVLVVAGLSAFFLFVYLTLLSPIRITLVPAGRAFFMSALAAMLIGLFVILGAKFISRNWPQFFDHFR